MEPKQLWKTAVLAAAVAAVTACTPAQIRDWQAWHQREPDAAIAFAELPEIQAALQHGARGAIRQPAASSEGYVPEHGWAVWNAIAECESGGSPTINTGNSYYGMYQFALGSWRAAGGTGYPHQASVEEQTRRAEILQDMQGFGAWPTCRRGGGLRWPRRR